MGIVEFIMLGLVAFTLNGVVSPIQSIEWPNHAHEVCFRATEPVFDEITCHLGQPGVYPPQKAAYGWAGCCFGVERGNAVLWALGSSTMSDVLNFDLVEPESESSEFAATTLRARLTWLKTRLFGAEQRRFELKPAELVDLLVVTDLDDTPVPGVRVSVADASMHLVSYTRETDADGYAVLPMIRGTRYAATIRASGFVQPPPLELVISPDELSDFPEQVVTLDRGVTVAGQIRNWHDDPVPGATIVANVLDAKGHEIWNSALDRPHALSKALALAGDEGWSPERSSITADERGQFRIDQVPHGKIALFAVAPNSVPGPVVTLDAREMDDFSKITLHVEEPLSAWFRITDEKDVTVPAALNIVDVRTGYALDEVDVEARSSSKIKGLPQRFVVTVISDGFWPLRRVIDLDAASEHTLVLTHTEATRLAGSVVDPDGVPVAGATLLATGQGDCSAQSASDGTFSIDACSFPATTTLHVEAVGFAPLDWTAKLGETQLIQLNRGTALQLAFKNADKVTCELNQVGDDGSLNLVGRLDEAAEGARFENLADRVYQLRCSAPGKVNVFKNWRPVSAETLEDKLDIVFEDAVTISGDVLEKYSGDAAYALVDIDGRTVTCDETGHFEFTMRPTESVHLYARHWLYGEERRVVSSEEWARPLVVRLNDLPPQGCAQKLLENGIVTVVDGASLLIDSIQDSSKWASKGLKRGDFVESCGVELVVVRDDRRIFVR